MRARTALTWTLALAATATTGLWWTTTANADPADHPVDVEVIAPAPQDVVGVAGRAWAIDLRVTYRGEDALARSAFTPQLTGPGAHQSTSPFPGTFSLGTDEALPGLVVLDSSTAVGAGPGQNLANLFNLTALTDQREDRVSVLDTWIVGAPGFGIGTRSTVTVAVVDDLDGDGRYDDAPAVVPDADGDGDVDRHDVRALGVASDVATVTFDVAGP